MGRNMALSRKATVILCTAALLAALALSGCGEGTSGVGGSSGADSASTMSGIVADIKYDLPEGFTFAQEGENQHMYTSPDYPNDPSSFNLLWGTGANPDFTTLTKEEYKNVMEVGFEAAGMVAEDMVVEEMEAVEVNGTVAWRVLTTYRISNYNFTCLQYYFALDTDYSFTYTDVSAGDPLWLEYFEASAESIRFIME